MLKLGKHLIAFSAFDRSGMVWGEYIQNIVLSLALVFLNIVLMLGPMENWKYIQSDSDNSNKKNVLQEETLLLFEKQSKTQIRAHMEAKCASAKTKLQLLSSLRRQTEDSDFPSLLVTLEYTSLG